MRFSKNIKNHYSDHKNFIPNEEIEKILSNQNQNQMIEKVVSLENFINQSNQQVILKKSSTQSNKIILIQKNSGAFTRFFSKTTSIIKRFSRFVDEYNQPEE